MSWDSVESAGRDAVGWSMVADYAKHRYEAARTYIAQELTGVNSRGLDVVVNDQVVGSVTCGMAKDAPDVTDDAAFLHYVIDNHPEALRVDSRWKQQFLNKLVKVADGGPVEFVDKQTGEVVPGVEMCRTRPYWKVTKDPEAKERMTVLLSRLRPTIEGFKQLEAGE